MIILDCKQNTPEWDIARIGIATSSSFNKIVTTKGVLSTSRKKYLYMKAGERISGEKRETYKNGFMDKGHEREDESRKLYEFVNDTKVEQVGFCFFDENKEFGCSPDGLVGEDGGFENKNAEADIQLERLEEGWSGMEHFQQVQGSLYVTGRKWWDLVSYSRGLPQVVVRFERNEEFIKKLAVEIRIFNNDIIKLDEKYSIKEK